MSNTLAAVVYIEKYAHYILGHAYLYDVDAKKISMGYSNWKPGKAGYLKAAANMAVPIVRYLDFIKNIPRDNDKVKQIIIDQLPKDVSTIVLVSNNPDIKIPDTRVIPMAEVDPGIERLVVLKNYCRIYKEELYKDHPPKDYWVTKDTIPTILLSSKILINTTRLGRGNDHIYHTINTIKSDDVGKKRSALSYMVVETKEPIHAVESVITERARQRNSDMATSAIRIDEIFKPYNVSLNRLFEPRSYMVKREVPMVITSLNGAVLSEDIYPASLASRAISDIKCLRKVLRAFGLREGGTYGNYLFEDITDVFIENGKLLKKFDKLKTIAVKSEYLGTTIPLVLGEDLPTRNILVRLAKTDLRIYIHLHVVDKVCYYGVVVENNEGVCVYANFYANTTFLLN